MQVAQGLTWGAQLWMGPQNSGCTQRLHLGLQESPWCVTLCLTAAVCRPRGGFAFHTERTAEKLSPGRSCQVIEIPLCADPWLGSLHRKSFLTRSRPTPPHLSSCNVPPAHSAKKSSHHAHVKGGMLE